MILFLRVLIICSISFEFSHAQDFENFPDIKKEQLLNDLEILHQGLDKFHSGMYWYTPKSQIDSAFLEVKNSITTDLNALEFHKLIAPIVSLSREDHTNIKLPISVNEVLKSETKFMPLTVVFLGETLYCSRNGSSAKDIDVEGSQIELINGETPTAIFKNIEKLLISDGFIKTAKYNSLKGFNFSKYYFYYYGHVNKFEIKFGDITEPIVFESLRLPAISKNLNNRYKKTEEIVDPDLLEYRIINDSVAYLGVHTFSNSEIKEGSNEKNIKTFLECSFKSIHENNIKALIIDVGENSGGTEGNEGLLYSYIGDNYQKYSKVRAKTNKAILDNGKDKPITLKTFGFFERILLNRKLEDGSYERKEGIGLGLMAYKKEPKNKFKGQVFVIISPTTYSGGSEFSNMMYTNDLATFVGQETGGGYLGNTSGYRQELVLPNSKIRVYIPALQFIMNVAPKLPKGSGVIPHHQVIPTFEQYLNKENASLKFILERLENEK